MLTGLCGVCLCPLPFIRKAHIFPQGPRIPLLLDPPPLLAAWRLGKEVLRSSSSIMEVDKGGRFGGREPAGSWALGPSPPLAVSSAWSNSGSNLGPGEAWPPDPQVSRCERRELLLPHPRASPRPPCAPHRLWAGHQRVPEDHRPAHQRHRPAGGRRCAAGCPRHAVRHAEQVRGCPGP